MSRSPPPRRADLVLVVAFSAVLALPLLGTPFGWDLAEVDENRRREAFPDLAATELSAWPDALDDWYLDAFGFRNVLIRRWNRLERQLDKGLVQRVIYGPNGWLFEDRPEVIMDYLGRLPTDEQDLEDWRLALEGRRDGLAERGIAYVFGVVPNKPTIYAEELPADIRDAGRTTRRELFLAHMAERSDLEVLDLGPALLAAKAERPIYLSHDTHWNAYGAFAGYVEAVRHLRGIFPELAPPLTLEECSVEPITFYGNLARYGDLPKDEFTLPTVRIRPPSFADFEVTAFEHPAFGPGGVQAGNEKPPPIYRHAAGRRRALVFHDSFFLSCLKLLSHHFAETTHMWSAPRPDVLEALVEAQQPDVVIEVIAERLLHEPPTGYASRR